MVQDVEKQSIEDVSLPTDQLGTAKSHSGSKDEDHGSLRTITESNHSQAFIDAIEPVGDIEPNTQNIKSNSSSIPAPLVVVPKDKRRGLFARFTLIPEVENPTSYKRKTKWFITGFVALSGGAGPMASAIFMPSLPQLAVDLDTSPTIANLAIALYMLSLAIFPLWWSSFSETLGRRSIYLVSFALFTLWSITSAVSTSISMLIVMRILSGGASASVQAVGAGSIADLWESKERGNAMGMFYLGPLLGPLFGPVIGGGLSEAWSWRATQWFQAIYGVITFVLILFFVPETLKRKKDSLPPPSHNEKSTTTELTLTQVLTRQSVQVKSKKILKVLKRCFIDPLFVLSYLRYPAVFAVVLVASLAFGSLYVLNISVQRTFSAPPYNYRVSIIGLLYLPSSFGYLVSSIFGGRWSDRLMINAAKRAKRYHPETGKLIYRPEDRLRANAWFAAIVFPGALLAYGWVAQYHLHIALPMVINFFFGVANMIILGVSATMLTEFMPRSSSSGIAVNNFMRNVFTCTGGIVGEPLIARFGNGWVFTVISIICWVGSIGVVWGMRRFGRRWSVAMEKDFAI